MICHITIQEIYNFYMHMIYMRNRESLSIDNWIQNLDNNSSNSSAATNAIKEIEGGVSNDSDKS